MRAIERAGAGCLAMWIMAGISRMGMETPHQLIKEFIATAFALTVFYIFGWVIEMMISFAEKMK